MSIYHGTSESVQVFKRRGQRRYTGATRFQYLINEDFQVDKMERTFRHIITVLQNEGKTGNVNAVAWINEWNSYANIIYPFDIVSQNHIVWVPEESSPYNRADIRKFEIIWWGAEEAGGAGLNNDCLWTCIRQATNYRNLPILKPHYFKQRLGLARGDLVPLNKMPAAEDLLRVNINCGSYVSPCKWSGDPIELVLENSHYELKAERSRSYLEGFLFKKRKVVFYKRHADSFEVFCDPIGTIMTESEYQAYYKRHQIDLDEITLVPMPGRNYENYEEFKKIYDEVGQLLKNGTKSYNIWIDQDQSPSVHQLSLKIFKDLSFSHGPMEKMDLAEDQYIKATNRGGLHYAVVGTYENAWELDVNSMYGSIMLNLDVPMCAPVEVKPETLVNYETLPTGIYKVNNTWLTNHEIDRMNGTTCERAFIYPKTTKLFSDFVKYFEELKTLASEPARKYLKLVQNTLWGALCARNHIEKFINSKDDKLELDEDEDIENIEVARGGSLKIIIKKENTNSYKTEWARIGSFITSYGRAWMKKILADSMNHVKHINTDGFVFCSGFPLNSQEDIKARAVLKLSMARAGTRIGSGLGEFKVPHKAEKVEILNKSVKVWHNSSS